MTHTKIEEQVDIYQLPATVSQVNADTVVTIGDLHGNAMKLMFMLVRHGITDISAENYSKLVDIYTKETEELTAKDIDAFNEILDAIPFNHAAIRLIGDELADRGSNDYFTLKILQKLKQNQVSVEILISNHSVEFLRACESYQENQHFHAPMLTWGHANSLEYLNDLVEKGLVSANDVLDMAQNVYKPSLKAISYSLNEDKSEVTIYSHAGIGLNNIENLAKQFNVQYKDSTATELGETIDRINKEFQTHVQNGTVNTLCPADRMFAAYNEYADLTDTPLIFIMWNRLYDLLKRPACHRGYNVVYVHGHDNNDPLQAQPHIHNLDNNLGKVVQMSEGTYTVLSTNSKMKKLQQSFEVQLQEIKRQESILRQKGHIKAADRAAKLHQDLSNSYTQTLPHDFEQFQKECKDAIREARPTLEKHEDWTLILNYLMAAITGIGALVALADMGYSYATGQHFSFFKTEVAQKVSDLDTTLDKAQAADFVTSLSI